MKGLVFLLCMIILFQQDYSRQKAKTTNSDLKEAKFETPDESWHHWSSGISLPPRSTCTSLCCPSRLIVNVILSPGLKMSNASKSSLCVVTFLPLIPWMISPRITWPDWSLHRRPCLAIWYMNTDLMAQCKLKTKGLVSTNYATYENCVNP